MRIFVNRKPLARRHSKKRVFSTVCHYYLFVFRFISYGKNTRKLHEILGELLQTYFTRSATSAKSKKSTKSTKSSSNKSQKIDASDAQMEENAKNGDSTESDAGGEYPKYRRKTRTEKVKVSDLV